MGPAKSGLADAINDLSFKAPRIPIIANCTGEPLTTAESIKHELMSQICECVNWKRSVDYMIGSGVTRFMEVGPGKALTGMVKRISRGAKVANIDDMDSILSLRRN